MDLKSSFDRVNKWYEDIKKEYQEEYPKMELPEDRKKFLVKYKDVLSEMKKEIDCLNAEVEFLDNENAKRDVNNQIRIFEMYVDELEGTWNRENYKDKNFDYTLFQKVTDRQNQIAKINFDDKKNPDVQKLKLAAIEEGDKLYNEALDRLKTIKENIRDSSERLAAINEEIRQQNYKLLEIDDLIMQSQNLFVRVKELITFFSKTFLKDKCLNLMIILLFVLCGAVFVLIIMEKAKSGSDDSTAETTEEETTTEADTETAALKGVNFNSLKKANINKTYDGQSQPTPQLHFATNYLNNIQGYVRYRRTAEEATKPNETPEETRKRLKAFAGIHGIKPKEQTLPNHDQSNDGEMAHVSPTEKGLLTKQYKTINSSK